LRIRRCVVVPEAVVSSVVELEVIEPVWLVEEDELVELVEPLL